MATSQKNKTNRITKIALPVVLMLYFGNVFVAAAQTKLIDSLKGALTTARADTSKINILNKLSWEYDGNSDIKKALQYAAEALTSSEKIGFTKGSIAAYDNTGNAYADAGNNIEALKNYSLSLSLNEKTGNKKGMAMSYNLIGIIYFNENDYSRALQNYYSSLKINEETGNKKGIAKNYNNISIIYEKQGNYPKALQGYLTALEMAKKINDKKLMSEDYMNSGDCYRLQGNYAEALKSQLASLKINEELNNKEAIAGNYSNIAIIYNEQENYTDALLNNFASLKINTELGNKNLIAINYINIGLVYKAQGDYTSALTSQLISLKINKELGNKNNIAINYTNIGRIREQQKKYDVALNDYFDAMKINEELGNNEVANSFINIGTVYTKQKKYKEGFDYLNKGLNLSKTTGNKERIKESYSALSQLDSAQGKWQDAYFHNRMYYLYRDSLVNEKNTRKLVQEQMKFEFGKKQDADKLEQLQKDAKAEEQKQKQKWITLSISLGLFILIIFSVLLFKRFKITVKQKRVIESQKVIVEKQKELVEKKNKEVTDSINYAKRIQTAILPSARIIKENLPNSFVLYLPKDIVAGDFYWMEKVEESILFAACDCTGHGVSGAMVSVVCNNALNRAVREFGLVEPAAILNKVADIVIESFAKSESEIMDGMDASLCAYYPSAKMLQWAGAFNPIYIIRNGELMETKGDKRPIGGKYHTNIPFTNNVFQLMTGDRIYIFSDGYADQFGDESGRKKLTRKRFKELILSFQNKPIDEQGKEMERFYNAFRNGVEQIDDILVMGVEV